MDYVAAINNDELKYIEKGTTVPLFQLACREAVRRGLASTPKFVKGLFGYLPNYADRYEARNGKDILSRFDACFGASAPSVVRKAAVILRREPETCEGRFNVWALVVTKAVPRRLSYTELCKILSMLFSARPSVIEGTRELLLKHNGKVPGFGFGAFSQLCHMCQESLFPVVNRRVPGPLRTVLEQKFHIEDGDYLRYPQMSRELGGLLEKLGFPRARRFRYLDAYITKDAPGLVKKRALRSLRSELKVWAAQLPELPPRPARTAAATRPEAEEGFETMVKERRRYRNSAIVRIKKSESDGRCEVCGFSFGRFYGPDGDGYMICHHKKPLSATGKSVKTTTDDLAIVCANCHEMLHRRKKPLKLEEVRQHVGDHGDWEGLG